MHMLVGHFFVYDKKFLYIQFVAFMVEYFELLTFQIVHKIGNSCCCGHVGEVSA